MLYYIYPYGEAGWNPNWIPESYEGAKLNMTQKAITMLQWKAYQTMTRKHIYNPILRAGKLTQQWIVDSYLQIEAKNLELIRLNQEKIKADLYQRLHHNTNNNNNDTPTTKSIILPSTSSWLEIVIVAVIEILIFDCLLFFVVGVGIVSLNLIVIIEIFEMNVNLKLN